MKFLSIIACLFALAGPVLQASSSSRPAPAPQYEVVSESTGKASWYGGRWIGRKTANGEIYRAGDMTAAHKTLPFGTMVRVTYERTQESAVVRINNRGPYIKGRTIDLSKAAAEKLGLVRRGVGRVRLEVLTEREMEAVEPGSDRRRSWFAALFVRQMRVH